MGYTKNAKVLAVSPSKVHSSEVSHTTVMVDCLVHIYDVSFVTCIPLAEPRFDIAFVLLLVG